MTRTHVLRMFLLFTALILAPTAHARGCFVKVIWPGGNAGTDPEHLALLASVLQQRLVRGPETGLLGANVSADGTLLIVRLKVDSDRAASASHSIKAAAENLAETGIDEAEHRAAMQSHRSPVACTRDELHTLARRYFAPGSLSIVSRGRAASR